MNKKELIQQANLELIENGNIQFIDKFFSPQYISRFNGKEYKGYKFIEKWVKQIRGAMPNIRVLNVVFFSINKDIIVWQRTLKGKHSSPMWGVNPSGKIIQWNEMIVSNFQNGKILGEWVVSELKGEVLSKVSIKK